MGYGPYTIQENGQVTLPKELRREFGLHKGDTVIFERTEEVGSFARMRLIR